MTKKLKKLATAAFALNCLVAQGAGIQAEHVVTDADRNGERVAVGRWIEDAAGRSRLDIDHWTQIADPVEGVAYRANSKRGRYSKARTTRSTPPMGSPLIALPGSLNGPGLQETSRIDLGTRMINGIECKGTRVHVVASSRGYREEFELEAWLTEAFAFTFNVLFVVRSEDGEHTTELRNVVTLTKGQLAGVFEPDEDWKESRFPMLRTNVAWSGIWPFVGPGKRVTGTVSPWPWPARQEQPRLTRCLP